MNESEQNFSFEEKTLSLIDVSFEDDCLYNSPSHDFHVRFSGHLLNNHLIISFLSFYLDQADFSPANELQFKYVCRDVEVIDLLFFLILRILVLLLPFFFFFCVLKLYNFFNPNKID